MARDVVNLDAISKMTVFHNKPAHHDEDTQTCFSDIVPREAQTFRVNNVPLDTTYEQHATAHFLAKGEFPAMSIPAWQMMNATVGVGRGGAAALCRERAGAGRRSEPNKQTELLDDLGCSEDESFASNRTSHDKEHGRLKTNLVSCKRDKHK